MTHHEQCDATERKELQAADLIEITRRGQGKTNLYKIKFVVQKASKGGRRIS